MSMRLSSTPCRLAVLTSVLLGAMGCGVTEGDYLVFRVSKTAEVATAACYFPDDAAPRDIAQDASTMLSSATLTISTVADNLVLNDGGTSLRGEETSDGFDFVATSVDIDIVGMDEDTRVSTTTELRYQLETSGSAIAGTSQETTTVTCAFTTPTPSNPGLCDQQPTAPCIRVVGIVGVELDDVDVIEPVLKPPAAPPPPTP
jgi:hypothetical protein